MNPLPGKARSVAIAAPHPSGQEAVFAALEEAQQRRGKLPAGWGAIIRCANI